ncbi:DUF6429 family protein [Geotalea toluenoxydans]|uniref:DUF6429 family protein n=1 Tax=Geotalea toluenoxydans TaxID=421624 RepID=UPI000B05B4C1|nr:DUF6429 family protein [Geotalea toluenoxydans]
MRYKTHGSGTSAVEVTNVSVHGLWLLLNEQEVFLPFDKFPWFQDAPIGKVVHVELPSAQHLYWPELDVDLEVESILHPEQYPLVSRVHEAGDEYASHRRTAELDEQKIDECVLALLQLTLHDGVRAWKGLDFQVMNRLFEKGYILDPRSNTKSVVLTEEGLARSKELFKELFRRKAIK